MTMTRRSLLTAMAALAVTPVPSLAKPARRPMSSFPKGFLWGASTAGHQIEGNNVNSDIWVAEHVKPTIYAEPSGDACNSFELWPQDLDLAKAIGLNTYRFSIEWSRIEPEPGSFSVAALDHYKKIVEGCLKRGLAPMVTFNHFSNPRWFAGQGGWNNPDAPALFSRFCDRSARHLAAGISYACTLNEPNLICVIRNAMTAEVFSRFKPMLDQMNAAAAAVIGSTQFAAGNTINIDDLESYTRNMIAAHKGGRAAIKAVRSDLPVGVTLAMPDDQVHGEGSIRDKVRASAYGAWLEAAREDDFLGVQNYERSLWSDTGKLEKYEFDGDRNAAGGEVYPASLANAVRYAYSVAKVPIIVTGPASLS